MGKYSELVESHELIPMPGKYKFSFDKLCLQGCSTESGQGATGGQNVWSKYGQPSYLTKNKRSSLLTGRTEVDALPKVASSVSQGTRYFF